MDLHHSKLLIVDDEPANIFMLEGILDATGYTVDTASGGQEALDLLAKNEYDAVLLDIMMPGITGLDVLRIAKQSERTAEIPFIMVSAKVESTDVEMAMELGAVEYIRKPIDEIELLARLRTIIKMRKQDIKLKLLYKQLQKKNNIITESIESAKKIQHAILPTQSDLHKFLPGSFIFFRPRDVVSGDFYWYAHIDNLILVVEGDCTGHGISGAFLSLIGSALLDKIVLQNRVLKPKDILEELSSDFIQSLNRNADVEEDFLFDGMDISIACIDKLNKTVSIASAGQDILYINNRKEIVRIQGGLFSIGYEMEAMSGGKLVFEEHSIPFSEIHYLILFSDGFIDQFGGPKDEKFLLKRFINIFETNNSKLFDNPVNILKKALENWMLDKHQTDDILVMGLDIRSLSK